jgi:hypothetical protein
MSKRLILGVLLAVVASAITASVVVVVGQERGGGDQEKIPPLKALEEWTPKTPPGTVVPDLTSPLDYGRFRILPPGSVPVPLSIPSPPPGVEQLDVDVRESDRLEDFRDHDLFFEPPYIPAGWELTGAGAETVIWNDGSHTDSKFALTYQRPGYFYIDIQRFLIAPDSKVQHVGHTPGSGLAYTLGEIRGVPVLFQHQAPLQVFFVTDNTLTFIESATIDFDELIKIADGLIAQAQQGSEEPRAQVDAQSADAYCAERLTNLVKNVCERS